MAPRKVCKKTKNRTQVVSKLLIQLVVAPLQLVFFCFFCFGTGKFSDNQKDTIQNCQGQGLPRFGAANNGEENADYRTHCGSLA